MSTKTFCDRCNQPIHDMVNFNHLTFKINPDFPTHFDRLYVDLKLTPGMGPQHLCKPCWKDYVASEVLKLLSKEEYE